MTEMLNGTGREGIIFKQNFTEPPLDMEDVQRLIRTPNGNPVAAFTLGRELISTTPLESR